MTAVVVRCRERVLSTEVGGSESWVAAARRLAAPAEPVADDLSGASKMFTVDPDLGVALRPMTRGDLRDVLRWRQADHVRRWFPGPEPTPDSIADHYGSRIDDPTSVRMSVVEVNGRSIGLVQDYVIAEQPGAITPTPHPSAIGGDYLIGERSWVGRGIGTRMLWAWLLTLPGHYPQSRDVVVAPDHRNAQSLRVLAKVGFRQGLWYDEPQPDKTTATMISCVLDLAGAVG